MNKSNLPILLFDLNGTLVSSKNRNSIRPYISELAKLSNQYRLGIYSSAQKHNVEKMIDNIHKQTNLMLFNDTSLILHRSSTILRKNYKTKKSVFIAAETLNTRTDTITIIDDEQSKALLCDLKQYRFVPTWSGDKDDNVLLHLVQSYVGDKQNETSQLFC